MSEMEKISIYDLTAKLKAKQRDQEILRQVKQEWRFLQKFPYVFFLAKI